MQTTATPVAILLLAAFLPRCEAPPPPFKQRVLYEQPEQTQKKTDAEEVLTPLTEEERSLNARELLLNQPDFMGDVSFFVAHRISGHGGAERLVQKGNRYRRETQFWIVVGEIGKPSVRLYPRTKSYDDYGAPAGDSIDTPPINPQAVAQQTDIVFKTLGATVIDGRRCLKIEASRKGKPEKYYFYVARDLKNLVVVTQFFERNRRTIQNLVNVSLEVPDSLVHIPPDYKPIERDRWTKLENAVVLYKGAPAKDATVFRSPGGHLFVRANDWTYLVRPKEGTVETAFQGLLVTRGGEYVWLTKETEGYSDIFYRDPKPLSQWETAEDRKATIAANSVTFRSTDYKINKAMIHVRW